MATKPSEPLHISPDEDPETVLAVLADELSKQVNSIDAQIRLAELDDSSMGQELGKQLLNTVANTKDMLAAVITYLETRKH